MNVAVCCACMPSLRLLLIAFFPKLFGSPSNVRSGSAVPISLSLCRRQGENQDEPDPSKKIVCSRSFRVDYGIATQGDDQMSTTGLVDDSIEAERNTRLGE